MKHIKTVSQNKMRMELSKANTVVKTQQLQYATGVVSLVGQGITIIVSLITALDSKDSGTSINTTP